MPRKFPEWVKNDKATSDSFVDSAIQSMDLKTLAFLHNNGFSWYNGAFYMLIRVGELDCIKYAVKHGCPYDKQKILDIIDNEETDPLFQNELRGYVYSLP